MLFPIYSFVMVERSGPPLVEAAVAVAPSPHSGRQALLAPAIDRVDVEDGREVESDPSACVILVRDGVDAHFGVDLGSRGGAPAAMCVVGVLGLGRFVAPRIRLRGDHRARRER